jgi:hypothetical protein
VVLVEDRLAADQHPQMAGVRVPGVGPDLVADPAAGVLNGCVIGHPAMMPGVRRHGSTVVTGLEAALRQVLGTSVPC